MFRSLVCSLSRFWTFMRHHLYELSLSLCSVSHAAQLIVTRFSFIWKGIMLIHNAVDTFILYINKTWNMFAENCTYSNAQYVIYGVNLWTLRNIPSGQWFKIHYVVQMNSCKIEVVLGKTSLWTLFHINVIISSIYS